MLIIEPLKKEIVDVDLFAEYCEKAGKFGVHTSVGFQFPDNLKLNPVASEYWHIEGQMLIVSPPYKWDGPSGPTFDTPSLRLASLVHDIVCEKTPDGYAVGGYFKRHRIYYLISRSQGTPFIRAQVHWHALNSFNWIYSMMPAKRNKR